MNVAQAQIKSDLIQSDPVLRSLLKKFPNGSYSRSNEPLQHYPSGSLATSQPDGQAHSRSIGQA